MSDININVLDEIVKAYDIRGVFPEQINADVCRSLGVGFAEFIKSSEPNTNSVVIARDMRPSGPELVSAFADGVMTQGLNVVDVGLGSTDLLYFASGTLDLPGVMFTASHNPAEYNGIKLCRSGAAPIGQDTGLEQIKAVATNGAAPASTAGSQSTQAMLEAFAKHVRSFIDARGLRPLKVVADTANGMGGLVVPEAFASLPFELEVMYPELDGTFPNHEANRWRSKISETFKRGSSKSVPISAWRLMATPIGFSWSTRREALYRAHSPLRC